jgi:hypothetical protein
VTTDNKSIANAHAHECVRLAGLTDDPEVRDQLLELALQWMGDALHASDSEVLIFPSASPLPPAHLRRRRR